jgi:hypothetical protein
MKEISYSDKTLTFASHSKKKNSEGCPSNQVSAAAMTSASDEKWRTFKCFFSRVGLRTYQHPCTSVNTISVTPIRKVKPSSCRFPLELQTLNRIRPISITPNSIKLRIFLWLHMKCHSKCKASVTKTEAEVYHVGT